jgi:hypothetical protein
MKFRVSIAVALGMALAFMVMPAANATSWYYMEIPNPYGSGNLCMATPVHNEVVEVTNYAGCETVTFLNPTTYNGNTWWEIEASNGLCLNMASRGYLYADSCVPGDYNELWYNHVAGYLLNLEGNLENGTDTFLQIPACPVDIPPSVACDMAAWPYRYTGWQEVPA